MFKGPYCNRIVNVVKVCWKRSKNEVIMHMISKIIFERSQIFETSTRVALSVDSNLVEICSRTKLSKFFAKVLKTVKSNIDLILSL